jgi:tellurite resistance protein TerC
MPIQTLLWIGFGVLVVIMLTLDLGVFNRKSHEVRIKEAILWSLVWITIALGFNAVIFFTEGSEAAVNFLTGYLIEKSLSVDNLFVFLLIFTFFGVPGQYQHKVLFWGIIGALVMRGIFIAAGIALISLLHWTIYFLGAFLVYTGIKIGIHHNENVHPEKNPIVKFFQKFVPITNTYHQNRFFIRDKGRLFATPLFVALVVIESTDVVFAVDSIPAILGITTDPFLVYTSNIFAILGLRAMYFALAGMMKLFRYLHYGLSAVLVFIGIKMVIADWVKMPVWLALGMVGTILVISVTASILIKEKQPADDEVQSDS